MELQYSILGMASSPTENKTDQWLGATITSCKETSTIIACAPRYVYFSRQGNKRAQTGNCFSLVSESDGGGSRQISPCREEVDLDDRVHQHSRYGMCQLGFSAALNQLGSRVVFGSVGTFYWQGLVYSLSMENEDDRYQTRSASWAYDDEYFGYSTVAGEFTGDDAEDYAVGRPRGAGLKGKVSIMREDLSFVVNVTGQQLGEYFGYDVAASDLNGDGHLDLVVGAPLYTDLSSDVYETGRIHVFYWIAGIYFSEINVMRVQGQMRSRSRFGSAVASLGDINGDIYGDIAVGAPYEGEGAVYIFLGSSSGIRKTPSQIIMGHTVNVFETFGFSLSGNMDMDGNGYPDLLVGAYASDMSVYLRTRAVIRVEHQLVVTPQTIKLDDKRCQLADTTPVVCFSFANCLTYRGLSVPPEIDLVVTWTLDAGRQRSYFLDGNQGEAVKTSVITLQTQNANCIDAQVYIRNFIRDKLSPVTVQMSYSLLQPDTNFGSVKPILDQDVPTHATKQVSIWRNCGSDGLCIPDLSLEVTSETPEYVIGTPDSIELRISVHNSGEDAFEATVKTTMPSGMAYLNVREVESEESIRCSLFEQEEIVVLCDIGNPMPSGHSSSFLLRLSPARISGTDDRLQFDLEVESSNQENDTDMFDNMAAVTVPVRVVAKIELSGVSRPEQIHYNSTMLMSTVLTERDAGPEVQHVYEIRNLGPSVIARVNLDVLWPSSLGTDDYQDLLYLTTNPEFVEGTGICVAERVNHRDIKLSGRSKRNEDVVERTRDLSCMEGSQWCTEIRCETGFLEKDDTVVILIRSRLWLNSITQAGLHGVVISSYGVARVTSLAYYSITPDEYDSDTYQIRSEAVAIDVGAGEQRIPLWVIAVSATIGLLLLIILVLCLWKCGFFKRQTEEDRENIYQAKQHRASMRASMRAKSAIMED